MRWEEPFHSDALHEAIACSLKKTCAQSSRAQNRRVHDSLRQLFPRHVFAERLHHVVHEIHHQLPLLRELLLFLLRAFRLPPCPIYGRKHRQESDDYAQQEPENHGLLKLQRITGRQFHIRCIVTPSSRTL